ncbi:hypothetical protein Q6D67_03705 [Haliea sp. E1-2-M8]|uniref:hypothetical protein n=1 Tax=Haliea sp. E1-2-M8 TaxID=3064706 RepID=UPI002725954C|nr:hypothetical protein [Haliea sp. E1-2-M8]MDO8860798.1 hypothetical protein [Haliea sp. E1-2-M8]
MIVNFCSLLKAMDRSGERVDTRQASPLILILAIATLSAGCAPVDRAATIDRPFLASSSPLRIVSANDGDALRSLGRPGSDFPDSITVIDLSVDTPPVTRTVPGTVPNTFAGAPSSAILSGGQYAVVPNNPWGSDDEEGQSPNQVSVVDLDTPDLTVVATLPLPDHAWQVLAHPDGDRAIAISDHRFYLLQVESGRPRLVSESERFPLYLTSFAISPDGRSIIATAAQELSYSTVVELHLFELEAETISHVTQIGIDPAAGAIDQPFAPRFSPDGSRALVLNGLGIAATPSLDAVLNIDLTIDPPRVTEAIPNVAQALESAAFHPSGKFAVIACIVGPYLGQLAVVDLTVSPMQLLYYLPMAYVPQGIEFSPDGSMLFVQATNAHHIDVYTLDGMKLIRSPYVLRTGEGPASMAVSPL